MNKLTVAAFILITSCMPALVEAQSPVSEPTLATLQKQMDLQAQRLERLELKENMPKAALAAAGPSVGLLVGEYIWTDPTGNRPLRLQGATPDKGVGFEGDGAIVVREFQTTGFLVDPTHMLTSGFLLAPWLNDPLLDESENPQVVPSIRLIHAYLPQVKHALNVELTSATESGDAVLCKLDEAVKGSAALNWGGESTVENGEPIVMLGYPGGVAMLMARVPDEVRREVVKFGDTAADAAAEVLAKLGYIQPLAISSHVSGHVDDRVFFESTDNYGNSGGPLINARGQIVAMSESTHATFPSFNMGISVAQLKSWIATAVALKNQ